MKIAKSQPYGALWGMGKTMKMWSAIDKNEFWGKKNFEKNFEKILRGVEPSPPEGITLVKKQMLLTVNPILLGGIPP